MADTGIKANFGLAEAIYDTFAHGVIINTSGVSGRQTLHMDAREFAAVEAAIDWVRRMRQERAEMKELV